MKWQVAVFALMPLAIGAMTQPCGRVLDQDPQHRFWLRSLPFFCIGDIFGFFLAVTIDYVTAPDLSWKHFKSELAYRFRDEDFTAHSVIEVEKTTLGRWILMILGGVPL